MTSAARHSPLMVAALACTVSGCAVQTEPSSPPEGPVATVEQGWDSQDGNPTHATHSYLTEYAIDQLKARFPEVDTYRTTLVDGANRELHELPITTSAEQEALRVEAEGTNWAANHPERIWAHAKQSYAAGDKAKAYWYLGIVLHWVEDMGVPAHAYHVIHQGTLSQKDNFEEFALFYWSPSYAGITRTDPAYAAPSDYVLWDGAWARGDFQAAWPGVTYTTTFFDSSWLWATSKETTFVQRREGRTATAAKWALQSAVTHWR